MTTAIRRTAIKQEPCVHAATFVRREVERRLEHVLGQLAEARTVLHQAQVATHDAEAAWLRHRQERERAAELVTELAELAESLQRTLDG